jgi:serine/threonine protein kinase
MNQIIPTTDFNAIYKSLNSQWRQLSKEYLPLTVAGSMWRFSRQLEDKDPEQGWKLHLSATILSAADVFAAVSPFLSSQKVMFKAPVSLYELFKLNSGILYGYSQVGKFITVYPRSAKEAVLLARKLYTVTRNLPAPAIPFDQPYNSDGCVYYRYGAFKVLEVEEPNGESVYAVRDPNGILVPDDRQSTSLPAWVENPFPKRRKTGKKIQTSDKTPLQTTFKAFEAVAQRGRGGVYKALDLSGSSPRFCILKEGRVNGEVSWDGRDGSWRVLHEGRVLEALRNVGVNVPSLYASFQIDGNSYIATELVEGVSLNDLLNAMQRRFSIRQVVKYGIGVATMVAKIHAAGWAWRDCKPGNIMITPEGELRPIDFEGACPHDQPDPLPWGTRFFVPPEWDHDFHGQSRVPEDLYAIGAILHLLLVGTRPGDTESPSKKRRNIPQAVQAIVDSLLNAGPRRRPQARTIAKRLKRVLAVMDAEGNA